MPSLPEYPDRSGEWVGYDDALATTSLRIVRPEVGTSFFFHCLREGFVRATFAQAKKWPGAEDADGTLAALLERKPMVPRKTWRFVDLDHEDTDVRSGSYHINNIWGRALVVMHGVKFSQTDLSALITRKGIGGAPFKKVHWFTMTRTLIDIVRTGDFGTFDSFAEFETYLVEAVNGSGEALDRSSIHGPAKQFWDAYEMALENGKINEG